MYQCSCKSTHTRSLCFLWSTANVVISMFTLTTLLGSMCPCITRIMSMQPNGLKELGGYEVDESKSEQLAPYIAKLYPKSRTGKRWANKLFRDEEKN